MSHHDILNFLLINKKSKLKGINLYLAKRLHVQF